jgi:hypothetical protein
MLGSTPLSALLGSGINGRDHEAVRGFIRAACAQGLSLLFIHPGSKLPADMRTAQKKRIDDKAAREAAQADQRRDWERVKSASGLALATSNAETLLRYLDQYIKAHGPDVAVNLAVEVGGSRLVVVDCDTRAQYENFLAVAGAPPGHPATVSTPGQVGPDGEMLHSDGGHFYFTVDEGIELPTNIGAMNWEGEDAFAVLWDRRYVLIPPSVRPEGAYELTGSDYPLSNIPVLLDAITRRAEGRANRVRNANPTPSSEALTANIDAWSQSRSWASILEPLGWTPTARADTCGCDAWTAGDGHASPRSATAHDSGCNLGRFTETNAPLHIWTDHPGEPFESWIASDGGSATMTKLRVVALTEYGGDIGAAMESLGVLPVSDLELETGTDTRNLTDGINTASLMADIPTATPPPTTDEREAALFQPVNPGVPTIAPFSHWRDMPPPEYVIEGLIEHSGLSSLIGPPGVGKSSIALDIACHIATGRTWQGRRTLKTKVLYLPGEGLSGAVQRLLAWEDAYGATLGDNLLLGDSILQLAASTEAWGEMSGFITAQRVGLIIFDTFARMSLGIEENSASDVGKAVVRFDQLRKLTGAGVMAIHHTGKDASKGARGSTALNGALDSEILVRAGWTFPNPDDTTAPPQRDDRPIGKAIEVITTKQKNAEQTDAPIHLLMVNHEPVGAPIITGPHGGLDPMSNDIVLARPIPEPLVEIAIRIRAWVDRFTEQGTTRAEIALGVTPDAYTLSRKDTAKHWKQRIAEAVDRALRYELIETLSGTPSGARYIPSVGTAEAARAQASADVLSDIIIT